jgi:hypothetical protein
MSHVEKSFYPIMNGYFMARRGAAWNDQGRYCNKKLCLVATDRSLLATLLHELSDRPDCHYVKYSSRSRDGMYLGRCFLMDENAVGLLWAQLKEHPSVLCSVQDDDFTARFRPSS